MDGRPSSGPRRLKGALEDLLSMQPTRKRWQFVFATMECEFATSALPDVM